MTRHGTSLAELLVALTLLGVSGTITVALVAGTGRTARRAHDRLAAERTVAALAALLRHDTRTATAAELSPTTPTLLWLDRPVGEAPVCTAAGGVSLRRAAWRGTRLPDAARDVVLLLDSAGAWHRRAIAGVAPASCPDGAPAWQLDAVPPPGARHAQVVEPARLAAYAGAGGTWLGLAGPGDPIQPFAGPLAASAGLALAATGGGLRAVVTPHGSAPVTLTLPAP